MGLSATSLDRYLADVDRHAGEGDEWPRRQLWPPLRVVPPRRSGAHTAVYVTKPGGLLGWDFEQLLKRSPVLWISRYGVPSREHCRLIGHLARGTHLLFVGELDPLDLSAFVALRSRLKEFRVSVEYAGIDSEWITTCRRHANAMTRAYVNGLPTIEMTAFEQLNFSLLSGLPIQLSETLGEVAYSLLKSNVKLEFEGATNPKCYGPSLSHALTKRLLAKIGGKPARDQHRRSGHSTRVRRSRVGAKP